MPRKWPTPNPAPPSNPATEQEYPRRAQEEQQPGRAPLAALHSLPPTPNSDAQPNAHNSTIENQKSKVKYPVPCPSALAPQPAPNPIPAEGEQVPYFVYSRRCARPIEWLFPGIIPLGKVTLLVGDPGIGKSLLAVDLAARVSRGDPVPPDDTQYEPARVLFLAGDGETEDILPDRLAAFGADLDRVAGIDDPDADDRPVPEITKLSLVNDLDRIHLTLQRWTDCRLIVIDPVSAFVDGLDANNNMAVRRLLTRLDTIARRYDAAILAISHFRKSAAPLVLYRSLGSIAFTLATRVVLTLVADPAVAGRRLLLPAKMNPIPHAEQYAHAFSIARNALHWDPDQLPVAPDELRDLTTPGLAVSDRVDEVARWLSQQLGDRARPATEIIQAAREAEIPWRVLHAARKRVGVRSIRDGKAARWYWKMRYREVLQDWELP